MRLKMNITKIELINFRNYKKKIYDKFSNLNIIIGKNGVGKTSIINRFIHDTFSYDEITNSGIKFSFKIL